MLFFKEKVKYLAVEYDEISWVRYSNISKPNMTFATLDKPIFDQPL